MTRHRLHGINGSPYSVKMRAILRYRRIPFDWVQSFVQLNMDAWEVRPVMMPILEMGDDGSQHVDSTPMAQMLEARDGGARSIYPDGAAHRFLALLIEDYADEWLTKPLFWYRWARDRDIEHAMAWLARDAGHALDPDARRQLSETIRDRQIGRMPFVGCTAANAPLIEATYLVTLDAMRPAAEAGDYLFGKRPSVADFALYGMLKQLGTDPTPRDVMSERLPALRDWIERVDDASGVDGEWGAPGTSVDALVRLSGRVYAPFLFANEAAFTAGESSFSVDLDGHDYRQDVFRYQVKCLTVLRQEYGDLDGAARDQVAPLLGEAGWLEALETRDGGS